MYRDIDRLFYFLFLVFYFYSLLLSNHYFLLGVVIKVSFFFCVMCRSMMAINRSRISTMAVGSI